MPSSSAAGTTVWSPPPTWPNRVLDTLVCEQREVLGGAAVSEHPSGPDYTVTSLSYVVSWLSPQMVRDLRLEKYGYHVYPQGPYFAPRRDGGYLRASGRPSGATRPDREVLPERRRRLRPSPWHGWPASGAPGQPASRPDPAEARLETTGRSPRPGRQPAKQLRGVDVRSAFDLTRLFTSSLADIVEGHFESDAMRGVLSVSGVIGMWAGPRSAGTAYVMLHHHVGDAVDGQTGAWGFARGGMGAVISNAIADAAAGARSRDSHRSPRSPASTPVGGRVTGVTLASGEEILAATVIATTHPKVAFLRPDRAGRPVTGFRRGHRRLPDPNPAP